MIPGKPPTYQVPRADHPWRQYTNRKPCLQIEVEVEITPIETIIPVREFLNDLLSHWDNYEVSTTMTFEGTNRHYLKGLPQEKQAAWIAGALKRHYVNKLK